MKKEFVNELGNMITAEVFAKEIDGVAGVLIYMEGPTSTVENHITRKEAEILCDELGRILALPSDA